MKNFNLIICGMGGQGVILASDIVGEMALAAGYDIKKTDTLGMAQRGGSVISHVRFAREVRSPLIKKGEADLLLGLEKLETIRWADYLKPGGIAIVSNQANPPLAVNLGKEHYPGDEEIIGILGQRTNRVYLVDSVKRATELGNIKTVNIFMLGGASVFLPIKVSIWQEVIYRRLPPRVQQINIEAFKQGRKELRNANR